jgi:hypothetical protein
MVRYNNTPFCVNSIALERVKRGHFLCWWRDRVLSENLLSRMWESLHCDFVGLLTQNWLVYEAGLVEKRRDQSVGL